MINPFIETKSFIFDFLWRVGISKILKISTVFFFRFFWTHPFCHYEAKLCILCILRGFRNKDASFVLLPETHRNKIVRLSSAQFCLVMVGERYFEDLIRQSDQSRLCPVTINLIPYFEIVPNWRVACNLVNLKPCCSEIDKIVLRIEWWDDFEKKAQKMFWNVCLFLENFTIFVTANTSV